jgi:hypothetical protein
VNCPAASLPTLATSALVQGQLVTAQDTLQPADNIPEGATRSPSPTARFGHGARAKMRLQLCQITIASFANPAGKPVAATSEETGASGGQCVAGDGGRGNIRQGMLEGSNVNIVEELVDMIECQRAYEINSKMISAVDEMLNANQILWEDDDALSAALGARLATQACAGTAKARLRGALARAPHRARTPMAIFTWAGAAPLQGHRASKVGDPSHRATERLPRQSRRIEKRKSAAATSRHGPLSFLRPALNVGRNAVQG